jgi:hypothetical protein
VHVFEFYVRIGQWRNSKVALHMTEWRGAEATFRLVHNSRSKKDSG